MQTLNRLTLVPLYLGLCILTATTLLAQEEVEDPYGRAGGYFGGTLLGGSYLSNGDELSYEAGLRYRF